MPHTALRNYLGMERKVLGIRTELRRGQVCVSDSILSRFSSEVDN